MELLDQVVFGFTLKQIGTAVVALAVLGWVLKKVTSATISNRIAAKKCGKCPWSGPVAKSNMKCPKCGGLLTL